MVNRSVNSSEIQSQLPLFHQKWWLDIVAGNNWKYLTSYGANNDISAVFPVSVTRNKLGLSQIVNPSLTPYLGPFLLNVPDGKISTQLGTVKKIYTNLIKEIPKCSFFQQYFSDQVTYPLPFFWHQFDFKLFYTYQLYLNENTDIIWNELSTNTRKNIRKAERILTVKENTDPSVMWHSLCQTYSRQNLSPPCTFDILKNAIVETIKRKKGLCLCTVDKYNKVHGAVFIVWDMYKAYYLLAGANPELRSSGASSLLLWHSIKSASKYVDLFDFYGSTLEPIEKFVRGFGGKPVHILVCVKKTPEKKMYDFIKKNRLRKILGFGH